MSGNISGIGGTSAQTIPVVPDAKQRRAIAAFIARNINSFVEAMTDHLEVVIESLEIIIGMSDPGIERINREQNKKRKVVKLIAFLMARDNGISNLIEAMKRSKMEKYATDFANVLENPDQYVPLQPPGPIILSKTQRDLFKTYLSQNYDDIFSRMRRQMNDILALMELRRALVPGNFEQLYSKSSTECIMTLFEMAMGCDYAMQHLLEVMNEVGLNTLSESIAHCLNGN